MRGQGSVRLPEAGALGARAPDAGMSPLPQSRQEPPKLSGVWGRLCPGPGLRERWGVAHCPPGAGALPQQWCLAPLRLLRAAQPSCQSFLLQDRAPGPPGLLSLPLVSPWTEATCGLPSFA